MQLKGATPVDVEDLGRQDPEPETEQVKQRPGTGIIQAHFKRLGFGDDERDNRLAVTGKIARRDITSTRDPHASRGAERQGRARRVHRTAPSSSRCWPTRSPARTVMAMPDDELLEQAARAALKAEIDYIRTARKTAFCLPASDQVKRPHSRRRGPSSPQRVTAMGDPYVREDRAHRGHRRVRPVRRRRLRHGDAQLAR